MEKQPVTGGELKVQEYISRIKNGESKDAILEELPASFVAGIEAGLNESENIPDNKSEVTIAEQKEPDETEAKAKRHEADQKKIKELREQLGIAETVDTSESAEKLPVNYIDVVIDDDFIQKNSTPNGGLRMLGGQANWKGEVDLVRYTISDKLSPQHRDFVEDKIEKFNAGQEKTYHHESHHIRNRENDLTPHVAAKNLREFLTFRVLDEMSAFMTGELYDQEITVENILQALEVSKQRIADSYYGQPFSDEANWYLSQHNNEPDVFSREINPEKYHQIMRQYFKIKGQDVLSLLQKSNKMSGFAKITDELVINLDHLLNTMKTKGHN